jgi:hypothetical protein
MSEPTNITNGYPTDWLVQDYNPREHLIKYERTNRKTGEITSSDYLKVPDRTMWFIRDQRQLIAAGLAKCTYIIQTDLVEIDRTKGFALFKTYVRDVLGNEATDIGSETAADFPDYTEKAATKSRGRALAALGYGTQFAIEGDEGDLVDAPVQRSASRSRSSRARQQHNEKPATLAGPASLGQVRSYLRSNGMATSDEQDSFLHSILRLDVHKKIPLQFTAEQSTAIADAVTLQNAAT